MKKLILTLIIVFISIFIIDSIIFALPTSPDNNNILLYNIEGSIGADAIFSNTRTQVMDNKINSVFKVNQYEMNIDYNIYKLKTDNIISENKKDLTFIGSYNITDDYDIYFLNRKIDTWKLFILSGDYYDKSLNENNNQLGFGTLFSWSKIFYFDNFNCNTGFYVKDVEDNTYINNKTSIKLVKIIFENYKLVNELGLEFNYKLCDDPSLHTNSFIEVPLTKSEIVTGRIGFEFDENFELNLSKKHYYTRFVFKYGKK